MDRQYLIASLFFIVAAVVAVMLVYPKYQTMKSSVRTANEKQMEFDSQIALVQDVNRLKSQHKEAKEEFERMARLIPAHNEGSTANLFVELEGITAHNGVLLDTVSFSENKTLGKEGKKYRIINAKLSLKGDYRDLKNFMRAIETNEHLMDAIRITVNGTTKEKKEERNEGEAVAQQTLSVNVDIDAYYQ